MTKYTISEHLLVHSRRQPIFIADEMFELQPSCIVLEIAKVRAINHMKKDDNDTDWEEISDDNIENVDESTMSSDIEEDDLNNQQEILHLDQACRDKIIQTSRVLLPWTPNCADSVNVHTSHPNLRH
jgi:hypothetical protein